MSQGEGDDLEVPVKYVVGGYLKLVYLMMQDLLDTSGPSQVDIF